MPYLGGFWRRRLLFDLLAGPNIAEKIVAAFEVDLGVGTIATRWLRLPSETYSESLAWGADNRETVLELAEGTGVASDQFRLDFFGRTMFWARRETLKPLRHLQLAATFPKEKGLLDGGLEHAVERLFATSTVAASYSFADSDGIRVADASQTTGSGI